MGISIIDEEHKKLIDITNMAIVAKKQNYSSEKAKEVRKSCLKIILEE
ncbi:hypothetical protein [Candidatus Scalindua japonica]|nr:hypothetical protein [Candidatus Scalindua japonica]